MADILDKNTICGRYYGKRYYLWQVLWPQILFVADIMDKDTMFDKLWTNILFVTGFI